MRQSKPVVFNATVFPPVFGPVDNEEIEAKAEADIDGNNRPRRGGLRCRRAEHLFEQRMPGFAEPELAGLVDRRHDHAKNRGRTEPWQ